MIIPRKGFKLSGVSRQMNSIPAAQCSHCIKGAAANAEERESRSRKVNVMGLLGRNESLGLDYSFWRELSQVVDAQLLFQFGDLIDHFEEAFVAEEFVFFFFEVFAE